MLFTILTLKIMIVATGGVVAAFLLTRNTDRWARSLQSFDLAQSTKMSGNSGGWDDPWRLIVFKALVVFFGVMAVLGVYVAVFSIQ